MTAARNSRPRPWRDALAVYLKPRVLVILFLGFSAGLPLALVRLDAGGLDAPVRRRSRHHRPVHAGRHALHAEVPLGAGGRRARRAAALHAARPAARLAGAVAAPADGGDRIPRLLQSRGVAVAGRVRRAPGRHGVGDAGHRDRRVPGREPRTLASRPPAWRPTSPPTASAWWCRARARSTSSRASSGWASACRRRGRSAIWRWRCLCWSASSPRFSRPNPATPAPARHAEATIR